MSKGRPAARARVEINGDNAKLRRALRDARRMMSDFFSSVVNAAKRAGKMIAAGLVVGLGLALREAVKLEDRLTRMQGVFGDWTTEVRTFSENLSRQVGRPLTQVLGTVTEIGRQLRNLGAGPEMAANIAQRLASVAEILGDALEVDPSQITDAVMSASRGRFGQLSRLGLGEVDESTLRGLADTLNLDLQDNADQLRMLVGIMPQLEKALDTNELVKALQDGQNANQKLASTYTLIVNKLGEMGTRILPLFSGILSGTLALLTAIEQTVGAGGGLMDVAGLILDAAKPFTDVLVAGLRDIVDYLSNVLQVNARYMAGLIQDALNTWYHQTVLRQDRTFTRSAPDPRSFETTNLDLAIGALVQHLKDLGSSTDALDKAHQEAARGMLETLREEQQRLEAEADAGRNPVVEGLTRELTQVAGAFGAAAANLVSPSSFSQQDDSDRRTAENTRRTAEGVSTVAELGRQTVTQLRAQTAAIQNLRLNTQGTFA